jgi:hypothetical protein
MNMSQPKMGYETLVSETFTSAQINRIREEDAAKQRRLAAEKQSAAKAAKRQVRI